MTNNNNTTKYVDNIYGSVKDGNFDCHTIHKDIRTDGNIFHYHCVHVEICVTQKRISIFMPSYEMPRYEDDNNAYLIERKQFGFTFEPTKASIAKASKAAAERFPDYNVGKVIDAAIRYYENHYGTIRR